MKQWTRDVVFLTARVSARRSLADKHTEYIQKHTLDSSLKQ